MQLYAFDREMSHLFKKGYPLPDPTTIKIVLSKRPISKYTQKEDHSLPNQEIRDVVVTIQISDLQITQYTPRRHCDTPVLKKKLKYLESANRQIETRPISIYMSRLSFDKPPSQK